MDATSRCRFNKRPHERFANPASASFCGDVNRILGCETVAHSIVKATEGTPTKNSVLRAGCDKYRIIISGMVLEPGDPVFERSRLVIVTGGRIQHGFIVNLQDSGQILVSGGTHCEGVSRNVGDRF